MGNGAVKISDQKSANNLGEFTFLSEKSNLSISDISINQNNTHNSSSDYLKINQYSSKIEFYKNDILSKKCLIYFSYCWFDEEQSHQIAYKLIDLGLDVIINKDKLSLDPSSAIYGSDMILICISKSYLSCHECLREAYLSFKQNVPIVPILLTTGFKPNVWLSQIIAGKRYTLITDSLDYNKSRDLIFKKIQNFKNKLVDQKQPNKKNINKSNRELTKLRENYILKFQNQILKEKKLIEEKRQHILEAFADLIHNEAEFKKEFVSIYRWFKKYPNVTRSNFVPFTPTGDINDAIFPLNQEDINSLRQQLYIFYPERQNMQANKTKVNLCLIAKASHLDNLKKCEPFDLTTKFRINFTNKPWNYDTSLANGIVAWKTIENEDFHFQPARRIKEINKRKRLDLNLKLGKKRRVELCKYFKCESDMFCKFAQRMLDNLKNFEAFCKDCDLIIQKNYTDLNLNENKVIFMEKNTNSQKLIDKTDLTKIDKKNIIKLEDGKEKIDINVNEKNKNQVEKKHPLSVYEPVFFKIDFYYKN